MDEKDKPSRFKRLELQGQSVPSQDDPASAGEGRFCPNCGAILQNYQQVCSACHKALEGTDAASAAVAAGTPVPAAAPAPPTEAESAERQAAAEEADRQARSRQSEFLRRDREERLRQAEARASFRMSQSLAYIAIFALYVLLRIIF